MAAEGSDDTSEWKAEQLGDGHQNKLVVTADQCFLISTSGINLNLTAEEKQVYGQLFRQADTEAAGIVIGEAAVKFFEKTRLDSRILGEVWHQAILFVPLSRSPC